MNECRLLQIHLETDEHLIELFADFFIFWVSLPINRRILAVNYENLFESVVIWVAQKELDAILTAEAKAVQIVEEVNSKAREIADQAREEADRIQSECAAQAAQKAAEIIEQAKKKAAELETTADEKGRTDGELLRQFASDKLDKAVELVIERIKKAM
jgi:vacuolar-type H+-ATPase subunit H